ncbi:MAG: hypothetical protein WD278_20140, partial [Pirellulales bacterium]
MDQHAVAVDQVAAGAEVVRKLPNTFTAGHVFLGQHLVHRRAVLVADRQGQRLRAGAVRVDKIQEDVVPIVHPALDPVKAAVAVRIDPLGDPPIKHVVVDLDPLRDHARIVLEHGLGQPVALPVVGVVERAVRQEPVVRPRRVAGVGPVAGQVVGVRLVGLKAVVGPGQLAGGVIAVRAGAVDRRRILGDPIQAIVSFRQACVIEAGHSASV